MVSPASQTRAWWTLRLRVTSGSF